jgi:hypothetical protein
MLVQGHLQWLVLSGCHVITAITRHLIAGPEPGPQRGRAKRQSGSLPTSFWSSMPMLKQGNPHYVQTGDVAGTRRKPTRIRTASTVSCRLTWRTSISCWSRRWRLERELAYHQRAGRGAGLAARRIKTCDLTAVERAYSRMAPKWRFRTTQRKLAWGGVAVPSR